ncbi:MAG: molybdopterin-dependent oxidoreductase, partial [Gammaproteobacteria bacterium]
MGGFCTGAGRSGDFPVRRMLDFPVMRTDHERTADDPGRRRVLTTLAAAGAWCAGLGGPMTAWARSALERLPGKWPLIRLTHRPPNYETPLEHLGSAITPNEAFFVRYHHAVIPELDAAAFRLEVGGAGVATPLSLGLEQLRSEFKTVAVTAVCQCSGNRRGLFRPRVAGLQWEHGAMGCAEWRGVRLADVLERAGLKASAVEVLFDAADAPPLEGTPDFIKSLPRAKALHPDTLLAFEMNGQPLPRLNGFPLRLVVPGWTATYWIKHLTRIEALETADRGFWMASAYRMPRAAFPLVERFPSQESGERAPVTEIAVNSLVTGSEAGGGRTPCTLRGIAWDAGHGLDRVEVSLDGGRRWEAAQFGPDLGRYALRTWAFTGPTLPPGRHEAWVRAANRVGQVQVPEAIPNPSGYQHNAWQRVVMEVSA